MSFLFDKKVQKGIKWVWVLIASIIIGSMVIGLFALGGGNLGY